MTLPSCDPSDNTTRMSRRRCLGLLAASTLPAGALPGCALVNTESPYWATVAAVGGFGGDAPVTRAQVDALPYASVVAWLDGGGKAFMVLGEIGQNGALYYYSQSRQVLVTRGPFLVQTVGLPGDLSRTRFTDDKVPDLRDLVGKDWVRHIDIQAGGLFDLPAKSRVTRVGTETVTILDRPTPLTHLREQVTAGSLKPWVNDYWIAEDTGLCWKSRQYLHDRTEPVNIEVTKPAG